MGTQAVDSAGIGALLRQVADDGAHLAKQEVALARIEFSEIARNIGVGTGLAVGAAMVGMLTVQMLVFGIVLLMGDALFSGHYWIAAFVLTAILALAAFLLIKRAMGLLSPKNMVPDQTIATLRRNIP